jgi:hypothetical protein
MDLVSLTGTIAALALCVERLSKSMGVVYDEFERMILSAIKARDCISAHKAFGRWSAVFFNMHMLRQTQLESYDPLQKFIADPDVNRWVEAQTSLTGVASSVAKLGVTFKGKFPSEAYLDVELLMDIQLALEERNRAFDSLCSMTFEEAKSQIPKIAEIYNNLITLRRDLLEILRRMADVYREAARQSPDVFVSEIPGLAGRLAPTKSDESVTCAPGDE